MEIEKRAEEMFNFEKGLSEVCELSDVKEFLSCGEKFLESVRFFPMDSDIKKIPSLGVLGCILDCREDQSKWITKIKHSRSLLRFNDNLGEYLDSFRKVRLSKQARAILTKDLDSVFQDLIIGSVRSGSNDAYLSGENGDLEQTPDSNFYYLGERFLNFRELKKSEPFKYVLDLGEVVPCGITGKLLIEIYNEDHFKISKWENGKKGEPVLEKFFSLDCGGDGILKKIRYSLVHEIYIPEFFKKITEIIDKI